MVSLLGMTDDLKAGEDGMHDTMGKSSEGSAHRVRSASHMPWRAATSCGGLAPQTGKR